MNPKFKIGKILLFQYRLIKIRLAGIDVQPTLFFYFGYKYRKKAAKEIFQSYKKFNNYKDKGSLYFGKCFVLPLHKKTAKALLFQGFFIK